MEWQDWFVGEALPAARNFADGEFVDKGPGHWFDQAKYIAMCQATGHEPYSPHRKFLLSHDSDPRHSFKAMVEVNGTQMRIDRRLLPPGGNMAIPVHKDLDYVPLCAKVPDCIQSPIEMFFAPVKEEFRKLLSECRLLNLDTGPEAVVETALQAFKNKGSAERVNNCWKHAAKSLLVWSTPSDKWVKIGDKWFKGTHGNWVPKELAG